jgi:4-amino-4-deoxy-L-arabinose transferase-like glycosyltransferase
VLLPLAVGGQRQYHYILPALPALAILTGWLLDEALTRRLPHWKIADALLLAMFVVMFLGMIAIPIIAVKVRPGGRVEDYTTAAVMGIAAVVGLWACIRTQEKVGIVAIALMAIAVTIVTQSWLPSLETDNSRAVARQVRALAPGPLCFYGENISFPLIFHLQRIVPRYQTPDELSAAGQQEPDLVVIAQTKANHTPPPLPASFQHIGKIEADEQIMDLYRQPK